MEGKETTRDWTIAAGIPIGAIYLLGVAMMVGGQLFFVFGPIFAHVAGLLLAWDWWVYSRRLPQTHRFIGMIVPGGLLFLSSYLAFRPAPIDISFDSPNIEYEPGSVLHGISWDPVYSEATIMIINKTENEYDNIDIFIKTDIEIAQVAIISDSAKCDATPDVRLDITGILPNNKAIPLTQTATPAIISPIYRVVCDKIIGKSSVFIEIALLSLNSTINGRQLSTLVASRVSPTWVLIDASYDGLGRRRRETPHQCFKLACGPVPKEIYPPHR